MRWMRFECRKSRDDDETRDINHFKDSARQVQKDGWFFFCVNSYVEELNKRLTPLLGDKFEAYSEDTMKNVLKHVRDELFRNEKKERKTRPHAEKRQKRASVR